MSRAPLGGADFLIVEAIRAGHHDVPAIADYARVEPLAAREALNRLRTTGQVRRYGTTRFARYILVKRRRDARRKVAALLCWLARWLLRPSVRPIGAIAWVVTS